MPIEVDLWLAQPRETFWYKMLLKEFESVDSLERMDKSDEARCIDVWLCRIILFIFFLSKMPFEKGGVILILR